MHNSRPDPVPAGQLFDSGVTKFLDADNKPILYGSEQDDLIFGTQSRTHVDIAAATHPLSGWVHNGIRYIGGAGDDKLVGTNYDDKLFGGDDNDLLDGLSGDDYLEGGKGNDRLLGEDGHDTYHTDTGDTLLDTDGKGEVWLSGIQLHGGDKAKGESKWTDGDGNTYSLGGKLIVDGGGRGTIVIENFKNHDLGINLTGDDKDDPLAGLPKAKDIVSPIALDLNGDGIATTSLQNGVYFDHDGNGYAEQTGWINRQDGFLVLDRDNNGVIDTGRELFGSQTLLANGQLAANGYVALAELDSNGDGQIDAQDSAYSTLRIWQDRNGDGASRADELITLSAAGVQSIATAHTATNLTDNGNRILQTGSFGKTDGGTGLSADIWFQANERYNIPTQQLPETPAVAALPDLPGFRHVDGLHQAMLKVGGGHLQALVQQFVDAPAPDRYALTDPIIYAKTAACPLLLVS